MHLTVQESKMVLNKEYITIPNNKKINKKVSVPKRCNADM